MSFPWAICIAARHHAACAAAASLTIVVAFWLSSLLPHESRERDADAVQHRRVLAFHALSYGPLETRRVQLPVVQDLDLLLSSKGRVMNHRIGALEQVSRIV